tara:strand:+ start:200 stop:418 length:219 start_codon:yes stop_codon:yes gene_type:complete
MVFKVGDLVSVKVGKTSDVGIIASRKMALLHYTSTKPELTDIYEVMIGGGTLISAHVMYLEKIENELWTKQE